MPTIGVVSDRPGESGRDATSLLTWNYIIMNEGARAQIRLYRGLRRYSLIVTWTDRD